MTFDLRDKRNFEFEDLNHLPTKGCYDLTQDIPPPLLHEILGQKS